MPIRRVPARRPARRQEPNRRPRSEICYKPDQSDILRLVGGRSSNVTPSGSGWVCRRDAAGGAGQTGHRPVGQKMPVPNSAVGAEPGQPAGRSVPGRPGPPSVTEPGQHCLVHRGRVAQVGGRLDRQPENPIVGVGIVESWPGSVSRSGTERHSSRADQDRVSWTRRRRVEGVGSDPRGPNRPRTWRAI